MADESSLIDYYGSVHSSRVYGTSSVKYVRFLRPQIRLLNPKSILDYGCGQSRFLESLALDPTPELLRYDPAIPDYATPPSTAAELLVNIDVLEHIDEADLDGVLSQMRSLCEEAIIVVDTSPAKHTLPDGRNAHVTLRSHDWWREQIERHFGPVFSIPVPRRSRAAFRTWQGDLGSRLRFLRYRVSENLVYYARRLVGRHKQDWKQSTTG